MTSFIIKQNKTGNGRIKVFNTFTGKQEGMVLTFGNTKKRVDRYGKITISKNDMIKYGVKGNDGRYRISIFFASNYEGGFSAIIRHPYNFYKNKSTGFKIRKTNMRGKRLNPYDIGDYNWSPGLSS